MKSDSEFTFPTKGIFIITINLKLLNKLKEKKKNNTQEHTASFFVSNPLTLITPNALLLAHTLSLILLAPILTPYICVIESNRLNFEKKLKNNKMIF